MSMDIRYELVSVFEEELYLASGDVSGILDEQVKPQNKELISLELADMC